MPIRKIYPVLTLFPSKDGSEWVAWTPEGYFTASNPSALRLIGYHINQGFEKQARWVSFSRLYDVYFRPHLIRLKLARPTLDLSQYTRVVRVKKVLEISLLPEVEILSPKEGEVVRSEWVTVKVRVKDKGGKIGDIKVYVNGKLSASIVSEEFKPLSGTVEKTYRVRIVSGKNIIIVQAMNGKNTVLSGPATVKIKTEINPRP